MNLHRHLQGVATVIPYDALAPLLAAIPSLPRPVLARLTERMIDQLDLLDGDPDVELNGDERDDDGDTRDSALPSWSPWQGTPLWRACDPHGNLALSWVGNPEDAEDDDPAGEEEGQ